MDFRKGQRKRIVNQELESLIGKGLKDKVKQLEVGAGGIFWYLIKYFDALSCSNSAYSGEWIHSVGTNPSTRQIHHPKKQSQIEIKDL